MAFDPRQPDQLARFGRQLVLPEVGAAGQHRLGAARVAVVGMGGLGCPAATYLAAAGVGGLVLVDGDRVETSNLNRQVLYGDGDRGRFKAEVAAERLSGAVAHAERVDAGNAERLLADVDLVLDATDNFAARFLLADACRLLGKPLVQAALTQFAGQLTTYMPAQRPCYRCFFPHPPADGTIAGCAEAGVLGASAGVVGSLQALEAVRLLVGGPTLAGHLLVLDLWSLSQERIALPPAADCPLCGPHPTIRSLADAGSLVTA